MANGGVGASEKKSGGFWRFRRVKNYTWALWGQYKSPGNIRQPFRALTTRYVNYNDHNDFRPRSTAYL